VARTEVVGAADVVGARVVGTGVVCSGSGSGVVAIAVVGGARGQTHILVCMAKQKEPTETLSPSPKSQKPPFVKQELLPSQVKVPQQTPSLPKLSGSLRQLLLLSTQEQPSV